MAIWVQPAAPLATQGQPPTLYIVSEGGSVIAAIAGAGALYT
jgi:hypothetical protein